MIHVTETPIDRVADFILLFALFAVLAFTLLYGVFFHWTATQGGRAVMGFVSSIDFVLLLIVLSKFNGGDYPGRDIVRLGVYLYILSTSVGLVVTLVRNWLRGSKPLDLRERDRHQQRENESSEETRAH